MGASRYTGCHLEDRTVGKEEAPRATVRSANKFRGEILLRGKGCDTPPLAHLVGEGHDGHFARCMSFAHELIASVFLLGLGFVLELILVECCRA
jgi:hypothetical protein